MTTPVVPSAPAMPSRLKSGLVFALVGFVLGALLGFLANICVLPVAALFGAAAGWLAARWETPASSASARQNGLTAGLLAGVGGALGGMAGGLLAILITGSSVVEWMGQQLGASFTPSIFWASAVGTVGCFAVGSLAVAAVFGLLGGLAWYQMRGPGRQRESELVVGPFGLRGRGSTVLVWMGGLLALLICCMAGLLLVALLSLLSLPGTLGG
jgi:hypothetical protein